MKLLGILGSYEHHRKVTENVKSAMTSKGWESKDVYHKNI